MGYTAFNMQKLFTYIRLCRPHQYIKNGFVWLPLLFAERIAFYQGVIPTAIGFCSFCLAASGVYVFNDLRDIEEDRIHPVKKNRPLASGEVSSREAIWLTGTLFALGIGIPLCFLDRTFTVVICSYVGLNVAYSLGLKNYAVVDVVCIAIGFVLRIFGGAVTARTDISHWIVIVTCLLAIFLALAKWRGDFIQTTNRLQLRKSLQGYSMEYISLAMAVMASVIIVCYVLYTVSPEIISKHGTDKLYLSGFWVVLGILRYMQITFVNNSGDSPTRVVLSDLFLQSMILCWLLHIFLMLHVFRGP